MIKFILGLVVGLVAGLLISPELTGTDMNAVVHDARSAIGRHLPGFFTKRVRSSPEPLSGRYAWRLLPISRAPMIRSA